MLETTLVGHEGEVTSLATDAGGRLLLSGSADGTLRVWDFLDGVLLRMLRHRTLGARAVDINEDATIAVSGGDDGIVYLWDVVRGERIHGFWGERGPAVKAVALSANGRIAVSGSREHSVRVWDVESRRGLRILGGARGHREQVTSVAISADGRRAISGSDDCTVRVWDLESGALEWTLEGHTAPVNAVAMTPDGRRAVSGSSDRTVKVWDLRRHVCLRTLSGHDGSVTAVSLTADAQRTLSGSSDQTARLWDVDTGQELARLEGHADAVNAVVINRSGTRAATTSPDRTIKVWRLDRLRPPSVQGIHAGAVVALVFSPEGRLCASGGADGRVMVRDVESGRVVRTIDAHNGSVRSLAFTADGSCILSGGIDDQYWLWPLDEIDGTWLPIRHTAPIDYCAFSQIARYLTTSCTDHFVYVWDVPSGALVERYGTRRLFDHLIQPAPRRHLLADSDTLRDRYLPGEAVYEVMIVDMSRDGRHAMFSAVPRNVGGVRGARRAAGTADDQANQICLLVLDLTTGEVRSMGAAQADVITAFVVDQQARQLLWARADHALELWDLEREARIAKMRGHTEKVNMVALTADRMHAVSCSRDRTVRIWSLVDGEQIAAFTADAALRSLATAPEGNLIAVGDVAGRVHLLRLETVVPRARADVGARVTVEVKPGSAQTPG
jgi:WD40 repeat protein